MSSPSSRTRESAGDGSPCSTAHPGRLTEERAQLRDRGQRVQSKDGVDHLLVHGPSVEAELLEHLGLAERVLGAAAAGRYLAGQPGPVAQRDLDPPTRAGGGGAGRMPRG